MVSRKNEAMEKETKKHEATESAKERTREYGPKGKKPARGGVRKRKSAIEGK